MTTAGSALAWLARWCTRRLPESRGRRFVRDRLRLWCPDVELATVTREGFRMYASPHDYASYRIYFFGDYDPTMTAFVKAHVPEAGVCWDVGAERGWFTLLMAKLVGPAGRVDAFEAFPASHRKLEQNLALNAYSWVNASPMAVSDRIGRAHFEPPSNAITEHVAMLVDCTGTGHLCDVHRDGRLEVPTVDLDTYATEARLERLDFVKLDIEGAEVAALRGARATLRRFSPTIAVEYNVAALDRAGSSVEELDALMEALDYDRFTFDGRALKRFDLAAWRDAPGSPNVLNVYGLPRLSRHGPIADSDGAEDAPNLGDDSGDRR